MPNIHLRIPDDLLSKIELRSDPAGGGISEAIRESLARYYYLLDFERAKIQDTFTRGELSLMVDLCNGTLFQPHTVNNGVSANVADAEDFYFEKWKCNRKELLSKLDRLLPCQHFALVDAIERFWSEISRSPSLDQPKPWEILKDMSCPK
jgi:hypothetical protein